MNLFLQIRNSTVETISKQLEYVTKGHVSLALPDPLRTGAYRLEITNR